MVDAIDAFMDRGCFGMGVLVFRGCRDSEVERCLLGEFSICIRNRCRQRFGAGVPGTYPNEGRSCADVSIHTVVAAVNGVHVGY